MQNKFFNKWLPLFILIQPLFDVITSFMTTAGFNLTIGIIVKMFILLLMGIYLVFVDKYKRKYNFIFIGILLFLCIGNVVFNFDILKGHFSEYAGYLMKYIYFVLVLFYFIKWYKNGNYIELHKFKLPFIIIALSFIISWITGTAFSTYLGNSDKWGNSGWFFSGNEIGALLSIIFPIALYNGLHNPNCHKWENILTIIIGIALLALGTKVGFLGYFGTIICYILYRLLIIKKIKLDKKFVFGLLCLLIPLVFWNNIPAIHNTSIRYEHLDIDNEELTEEERNEKMDYLIYSGRSQYVSQIMSFRKNINVGERFFGKVFERDKNNIYITEQDPFDIYFMFGLFGFLIIFSLILYVIVSSLIYILKDIKNKFFDIELVMTFISIVLALGVAFMSGHTLLAPSVSTLMILIMVNFYVRSRVKMNDDKKSILIGSVHMEIGGIERTLISLLKRIDYDKYNVDLMLLKPEGEFYNEIPKKVNIITPYDSNFLKKIVLSNNKFCKIIKHLLFNYYTGWLFAINKHYDTAISYSGYYSFVDMYVGYSYATKKMIWVHTDVEYNCKNDEKYFRKFERTKNKYKKFDNIVGVSEGVKNSFDKIMPEYKDKTIFLWNIIDFSDNKKDDEILLEGNYRIVTIGRLCKQKRFDKIIDIANDLPDDIKIYIVGGGELYNSLNEKIKEKQLEHKVILLGEQSNIQSILRQADLFLSVSDYEGLPTVLLESLLCNISIVATDVCGNSDIYRYIAPKGSMILCKNNISSISKAILKAYRGSLHKKIKFDLGNYNNENMKKFYKIVGE